MRCLEGTSSFGDKSIAKCTHCNNTFSSNELVQIAIESRTYNWLNSNNQTKGVFEQDKGVFCHSSTTSKQQSRIELYLMNRYVKQAVHGINKVPVPGTNEYESDLFFINSIKNIHNNDHCSKCFKDNMMECRMKYPKKPSEDSTITFDMNQTESYGWKGNYEPIYMYHLEPKRHKCDAFINTYNEYVSVLFNCNNNVIAGLSGKFYQLLSVFIIILFVIY